MKVNRRILSDSKARTSALLIVALMLSAFLPLSMALLDTNGGRFTVSADISPVLPVTTDDLVCSIDSPSGGKSGSSVTYAYAWYKNGVLQPQLAGDTVDASYTTKGEVWKCVVTANDPAAGIISSQDEVVIHNSAPTAPVADVVPDLPRAADNLTCSIKVPSSDADGDVITYTYTWYRDGEVQPQLTRDNIESINNARGQAWRCLVTASDGAGGNAGSFDEVTIDSGNSAPSVPTIDLNPHQPISTDDLVCTILSPSSDPDRDSVTYTYAWYKDDVLQSEFTDSTVDSSNVAKGETWKCVVTASDGMGGTSGEFCESTIQNSPPTTPTVDVTPNLPTATDSLVCSIVVPSSDADGDIVTYTYAWYKNGVLQSGLTSNTVDASYAAEGLTWRCVVTANDGAGGSASGYDDVGTPPAARDLGTVNSLMSYGTGWRYLTDATDRAHVIKACQDFGINTLEIQVDGSVFGNMVENPASIVTGIQELNAAGIQVWACWNARVNGWDQVVNSHTWHEFFDVILKWNKDHPTAKFTALQFDLEPPGGSTLDQHKAFLEGVYTGMQTMRGHVVDGTETIDSQGLPVVMFCDLRWGGEVCAGAWAQVVSQLDVVEIDYYRWGGGGYPDGIERSVANAASALAVVIAMNRQFTCTLACDELPKTLEAYDPYCSRFNLGRAGYQQAMEDYAAYFNGQYPGNFVGFNSYFDVGGFIYWFNIDSVTSSPSGNAKAGDTLTVSYNTYRRTDRYMHRVFGIQMEFKDSAGTVVKANKIIDLIDGQTTNRTISLTVPSGLASGAASVRLTMWAVGWYDENYYDKLWYGDFAGYNDQLLAMSMDELAAMTTGPKGALTGKRSTFFILQATDWQSGITLTTG